MADLTLAELRQAVRDRVLATDAAPYNQRKTGTAQAWTESDIPLSAVVASAAQGHLSFAVSVISAPVRQTSEGQTGLEAETGPIVAVDLLYSLRPGRRVADEDKASDAAQALAASICTLTGLFPEQVFRATLAGEGQYLAFSQEYSSSITVTL